ncbi:ER membrane protein complex subunit 10 [Strongylocentrotus purpuratus]|uniref:ER membrane protein complex subunit 10 n=1 Tax=Strongylocentrotus purpuratus TaxID=7668 RepID=A0A7M7P4R0_STRPU|nr:ER membrane protein complex subunit 10 [Strongylocentrotus purpuratus]
MAAPISVKNSSPVTMYILQICLVIAAFISLSYGNRKVLDTRLPIHHDPEAFTTYVLVVEHSFDQGMTPKFSSRGTLSFRSNKDGQGMFVQTAALTAGEKRKLKDLAKHDGIYRIRVPTSLEASPDDSSLQFVSTFTRACALLESRLTDNITVSVDQSGNVLGVSLVPMDGSCDRDPTVESSSLLDYFNTSVALQVTTAGPTPDTQAFVRKMEDEREMKEKGKGPDNRSFLAKYWMYIVPVVLFVLVSSGGDQARS